MKVEINTTVKIEIGNQELTLTDAEARALYNELHKSYGPKITPPVWREPIDKDPPFIPLTPLIFPANIGGLNQSGRLI